MIDLSEIITDPDFAEAFNIERKTGSFNLGRYVEGDPVVIPTVGIITPANALEIQQIPEGDRLTASITVKTTVPLYVSRLGLQSGVPDLIDWNGSQWKVSYVWPWQDFGYYKAVAVRLADSNG